MEYLCLYRCLIIQQILLTIVGKISYLVFSSNQKNDQYLSHTSILKFVLSM